MFFCVYVCVCYSLREVLMRVGPLWSLQVEESGEGGGGMSGFTSHDLTSIFTSGLGSLSKFKIPLVHNYHFNVKSKNCCYH